jgi:N-acetylglucosamine-6-phosphate deacetylase
MIEGMQAGIRHSTHFFNAMSKLDHRNPNAVGAILYNRILSCEIIADGKHVHPDLIRLSYGISPTRISFSSPTPSSPTEQKHKAPFSANREEVVLSDGLFLSAPPTM